MSKTNVVKQTTTALVFIGTGHIINSIVVNNTDTTRFSTRLTVGVTTLAATFLVAERISRFTSDKIDHVSASLNNTLTS